MNLIKAIKSGKHFKRKNWTRFCDRSDFHSMNIYPDDVLAEDWELREEVKKPIVIVKFVHENGNIDECVEGSPAFECRLNNKYWERI